VGSQGMRTDRGSLAPYSQQEPQHQHLSAHASGQPPATRGPSTGTRGLSR
jgi:hypothetical protein